MPEPTDVERRLVDDFREGRKTTRKPDEDCISGSFLRDLLLGRHIKLADMAPSGIGLAGFRIDGEINLELARDVPAIAFQDCTFSDAVCLRNAHARDVTFMRCTFRVAHGPVLDAAGAHIETDFLLQECDIVGNCEADLVVLRGALIGGRLGLDGTRMTNRLGSGLNASGIRVSGGATVRNGFRTQANSKSAALSFAGATIEGDLDMTQGVIENTRGPALDADMATLGGCLHVGPAVNLSADSVDGAALFRGMTVDSQSVFSGVVIINRSGPAILADGMRAGHGLYLGAGSEMKGVSGRGTLILNGAAIKGEMVCEDCWVQDNRGPAIAAQGLTVQGNLTLAATTTVRGFGDAGVIDLSQAVISGKLQASPKFESIQDSISPQLLLTHATCAELWMDPDQLLHADVGVAMGGLTYRGRPKLGSVDSWLTLLGHRQGPYEPQPYSQLANGLRADGLERESRAVLIAQQDQRRRRLADISPGSRPLSRGRLRGTQCGLLVQKILIGYGYRTWPAFLVTALIAVLCGLAGISAGHTHAGQSHHFVAYRPATVLSSVARKCSTVEQIGLAESAVFKFGAGQRPCSLDTATSIGETYQLALWVLEVAGWSVATIAVAGYTGLVRRT